MGKQFHHIIAMATAATLLLAACDNIADDERLIYVKPAQVQRAVLIEDFTGQRCVNCPYATQAIELMVEQYGDSSVIAVGIHSGPFAKSPTGTPYAFYTAEGEEYFNHWDIREQPSGMVNRQAVSTYTSWAAQVYNEIQRTAPLSIDLACRLDTDSRALEVTSLMMARDGAVDGKLQLWLIEDSITAFQYMPDGAPVERNYVHNHVFRQALNGTWGEDISLPEGETATKQTALTLDAEYNLGQLSVVAFVYDDTGVLQATKCHLTPAGNETRVPTNEQKNK